MTRHNTGSRHLTYIHQHFKLPEEAGGVRSYEFAKRLSADGYHVTMICGGPNAKEYDRDGFHVVQLPVAYDNAMSKRTRIKSFLAFTGKAIRMAATTPADVIYATSTPLTVAVPGMLAALAQHAPFVFEVRDLWPSVPARLGYLSNGPVLTAAQTLERLTYAAASEIVVLSPTMRDGVLQTAPRKHVTLVPNAADFDLFDLTNDERSQVRDRLGWTTPTVVYAGSFGETYRIPWLAEVAIHLKGVRMQIMGAGHGTEPARKIATAAGLNVPELLPGSVPKDEVAPRVAAADAVISSIDNDPALGGNSLNKVFDALAAGRPVFFNHDGWLSELLISHGAGWRLPDNPADAAAYIAATLADPEAVERAGQQASALGHAQFDRDMLYRRFKGVIDRAAGWDTDRA